MIYKLVKKYYVVILFSFILSCNSNGSNGVGILLFSITPQNSSKPIGVTQRFRTFITYMNNEKIEVTNQTTFSSSNPKIALVNNTANAHGYVKALKAGVVTIRAKYKDKTVTADLTVTNAQLVSLNIIPSIYSLPKVDTYQLKAIGKYSDGGEQDVTNDVVWNSNNTSVIEVNNIAPKIGEITVKSVGNATITGKFQNMLASSQINGFLNTPKVTLFTESDLPNDNIYCQNITVNAINNNGVVVGLVRVRDALFSSCKSNEYLWDNNSTEKFTIVQLPEGYQYFYPDEISTNLVVVGTLGGRDNNNVAGYNNYRNPTVLPDYSYMYFVSENGKYAIGFNAFSGHQFVVDIVTGVIKELKYNNAQLFGQPYSVSNDGTVVTYTLNSANIAEALICSFKNPDCIHIHIKNSIENAMYLRNISSDGKIIYGWLSSDSGPEISFVKIDPVDFTFSYIIELKHYQPQKNNTITNDGVVLVQNERNNYYIYLPSTHKTYSLTDVLTKLNLPNTNAINLPSFNLSENGNYMVFEYNNDLKIHEFGAKVYFPGGLENYIRNNL